MRYLHVDLLSTTGTIFRAFVRHVGVGEQLNKLTHSHYLPLNRNHFKLITY